MDKLNSILVEQKDGKVDEEIEKREGLESIQERMKKLKLLVQCMK
jgi:hypothetical protein